MEPGIVKEMAQGERVEGDKEKTEDQILVNEKEGQQVQYRITK